jgi:hypothetical protein
MPPPCSPTLRIRRTLNFKAPRVTQVMEAAPAMRTRTQVTATAVISHQKKTITIRLQLPLIGMSLAESELRQPEPVLILTCLTLHEDTVLKTPPHEDYPPICSPRRLQGQFPSKDLQSPNYKGKGQPEAKGPASRDGSDGNSPQHDPETPT